LKCSEFLPCILLGGVGEGQALFIL